MLSNKGNSKKRDRDENESDEDEVNDAAADDAMDASADAGSKADDSDSDVSDSGQGYGKRHGKKKRSKAERAKAKAAAESNTSISAASINAISGNNGGGASGKAIEKVFWLGAPGQDPPSEELKKSRQSIGVNVKGNFLLCPGPVSSINDKSLPECFAKMFQAYHLAAPTPIQQQCWPALLSGANVLGISPTGSGKTIAFGLPIIPHACAQLKTVKVRQGQTSHPIALILTPTRELAIQVAKVFKHFKKSTGLNTVAIYGGDSKSKQIEELIEGTGAHIIAGTPGRLLDLISHKNLYLDNVSYLVIDEADRMLALGFQEQISILSDNIRSDRQTALFSATFPGKLRDLTDKWVKDAVIIRCSTLEMKMPVFDKDRNVIAEKGGGSSIVETIAASGASADKVSKNNGEAKLASTSESSNSNSNSNSSNNNSNSNSNSADQTVEVTIAGGPDQSNLSTLSISKTIEQKIHVCASHKKPRLLIRFITKIREQEAAEKARQPGSMMIFCTKIKTLSFVMDFLKRHNVKGVHMLHGNMPQSQREQVLNDFRAGKIHSLCSTDVAARGIHIKRLKYVFNYDFPLNLEQYCHRVGRTGRQGERGEAYSLITRNLAPMASGVIDLLKACGQTVEPNLIALAEDYKVGNWVYDEQEEKNNNNNNGGSSNEKDDLIENDDFDVKDLIPAPVVKKVVVAADSFLDDT